MSNKVNLLIDQGADFLQVFNLLNSNNEPFVANTVTGQGQIRKNYAASNVIPMVVTLSTGALSISLSAAATANTIPGRYVYDVVIHDTVANTTTRIVEGIATITPAVTH